MRFDTLEQVNGYLAQYIQPPGGLGDGAFNFARMQEFMKILDNPQDTFKSIHVAGTSGKGSTCYVLSTLLQAYGFKVGLTVSPHMVDIRERSQINNALLSVKQYALYLTKIIPAIDTMKESKYGAPSFFEITMAHAFCTFAQEQVDYAVIETGLGGRYDASNVITRTDKLALITPIGLDHTDFLGDTIAKIAGEKACIIQPGNTVLSVPQIPEAHEVIKHIALERQAKLKFITIRHTVKSSLHGEYQHENVSLALASLYDLSKRDGFNYDASLTATTLRSLQFRGRFEIKKVGDKTVVLDGAHNPQKMAAFIQSLKREYPDQHFDFLIAFSKTKDFDSMLDEIVPVASHIIVTTFGEGTQGMHICAQDPELIRTSLQKKGCDNVTVVKDCISAWLALLKRNSSVSVVTGSLYLLSDIYVCISDV